MASSSTELDFGPVLETLNDIVEESVGSQNTGSSFFGDFTEYAPIEIGFYSPELAVLFFLQLAIFVLFLGKLNGRFLRMTQWIHSLDFEILGNIIKPTGTVTYLSIIGYSYLLFPFVTLIFWGAVLIKDASRYEQDLNKRNPVFLGAISVFLLGLAIFFMAVAFMKISWNNYRFKMSHAILCIISYLLLTAWQFMIMFVSIEGEFNFQALAVVFLTQSGIVMNLLVYINLYENKFNLIYFLNKFMKRGGKDYKVDPNRENDILEEIEKQKGDDDYQPKMEDIFDLITIGKISEKRMLNAFGRGFQRIAMSESAMVRYSIHISLMVLYFGILALFSWFVYDLDNESKLGIVSSVAVFVNDIYIYLMYNARVINRISVMSLLVFSSRLFILIGGSDYWLYGYLVIYVWLECIIAIGIVQKRLPLNTEMNSESSQLVTKRIVFTDLARVPEFIFFVITVSVIVSIVIARSIEPKGVYLKDLDLGDGISNSEATAYAVLIVVSFLFITSWIRAFRRKIDKTYAKVYIYLCNKKIDTYYILCIVNYLVACLWTVGLYPQFEDKNLLVGGFILPAIAFCFLNIVVHYISNGFYYIENCNAINKQILAHNKRVTTLKEKARELKKQINDPTKGIEAVYGEENDKLVRKVMQIEQTRRQAMKLQKQLGNDEIMENFEQKLAKSKTGAFGRSINNMSMHVKMQNATAIAPDQEKLESIENEDRPQMNDEVTNGADQLIKEDSLVRMQPSALSNNKPGDGKMTATMMGFSVDDTTSDEDIDAVESNLQHLKARRIDKKKKAVYNWQEEGYSMMGAFFSRKLRSNDYVTIWSFVFMFALIIVYAALSANYTVKGLGIMYGVVVLHVIILALSLMNNIIANRQASLFERIMQVVAFLVLYIAAIVYLLVRFDVSLLQKDDDELSREDLNEKDKAIEFITGELILIPFITAFIALACKAYRDNMNGRSMTMGFWILMVINFIHGIGLVVVMYLYLGNETATFSLFALALFLYAFIQYVLRIRYSNRPIKIGQSMTVTPYTQNRIWNVINVILALGIWFAVLIYSLSDEDTSDYAAASYNIFIVLAILTVFTLAKWIADRTRLDEMPIYYSPWIFPIYKYYPKDNDVEPYVSSVTIFYGLCFFVWVWAIWTTVAVLPSYVGVCIVCAIQCTMLFVTLYFMNTNNLQYKKLRKHVDHLVIKQAWLDAKENLARMLQIDNRSEYISYEKWWRRRHDLRNYMLIWRNDPILRWPEDEEFEIVRQEFEEAENQGAYLRQRIEEWADPDEVNLDSWEDCLKFMFETDKDVRRAYMAELETVIQFQLIILQNARQLQETERKYLFKFITEKRAALYLVGINFEVQASGPIAVRYNQILTEIKKLSPDKLTLFNALKVRFIDEQRQRAIDEQLAEEEAQLQAEERAKVFAAMSQEKQRAIEEMRNNPNMPIEKMPDCPTKLEKIRSFCKTEGCKFSDAQFDHEKEEVVLGQRIFDEKRTREIDHWKRASDIPGACLFKDGASHEDITQGLLGDCYFLSALSVLGNDRTVQLFVCQQDSDHKNEADPNHWRKTGCFMLKFNKNGDAEYVIVDDWLPVKADGSFAFTQGGEDGLEIWPAILEKAYAKLYGSYTNIEAGKVHLALGDLVENGFPEQLALKTFKNNVMFFQQRLRDLDKVEALMGAGSPEHEQGDRAVNEEGIVQGHAYAILDVADYQGEQLMKLRNPHGKADYTSEWNGDWADDSEQWTEKAKASLNYEPNDQVDGVFWMSNNNFLNNFKYIYVCRELTAKLGWHSASINSSWRGPSSAGFPGKVRNVPQFKITVHTPCPGYIALMQKDDSGSSFKGKNFIGWMLGKCEGKLMTKIDKRQIMCKAGISDLKMLSSAVEFDESLSYPYSFTVVCGSRKPGSEGEGDFELTVYSRDPKIKIEKLNHHDQ